MIGITELRIRWKGQIPCIRGREIHENFGQESSRREIMWET
jgi:hypothetical protein